MTIARHSRGFTLLELLITLVVLGVVIGVAVPNFQNYIVQNRVKTGAQTLFMDLTYARSEAIKRNEDVTIQPNDGDWQQGWVVLTETQVTNGQDFDSCQSDPANCLSLQQALEGLTITFTSTGSNVTYESDGRVANTATFDVCDDDQSADITEREESTSLTGRPTIDYDGACS